MRAFRGFSTTARVAVAVTVLLAEVPSAICQHMHTDAPSASPKPDAPYPLFKVGLGKFTHPISSSNAEAQAYFNQGFQLMYAFDGPEAAKSFVEAEQRDPNCAICFWGEAWSRGPFLNGPMFPNQAPKAFAAIQKAVQLAPNHASEVERALIQAMSKRYVQNYDMAKRREQDAPYAEAMRLVYERFPDDLDVATLYGEALFLLEPRRGSRDIKNPNVQRIASVLEGVLAVDSRHVGACHFYIHLTEATTEPGKAEACADTIGNAVPGASHLNHMPSHTWNQLGRWGDSVRANIQARISDQKASVGEGFAIYPSHNLHMLIYAASMDAQGAVAIQAAKEYAQMTDSNMYQILTLVRFGRSNEIAQVSKSSGEELMDKGVSEFGTGFAAVRQGNREAAQEHLKLLKQAAAENQDMFRINTERALLSILQGILEAEVYRSENKPEQAMASLEEAVKIEDTLIYDEPEALPFSARHWLGSVLLQSKKYPQAERVYRDELKKHPHNAWSLCGLKTALAAQSQSVADVEADLKASSARSDTWIYSSSL